MASVGDELARAVRAGDRRALAKAITLVESTLPEERDSAARLLSAIAAPTLGSFRIGVTGVPGAGKSTLIDVLGYRALAAGARVAVLAVDPSSHRSGGSLLGDKTRMVRLSAEPHAFIRPSPTLGVLGGTASRTREVISLCEAAGYDVIFVETVGVGQSEEHVADMVDCVLLLLLAGAGDEVSSLKRGVLEAADLIAFNKADGDRAPAVEADAASLRASLAISHGQRVPDVLVLSALHEAGVAVRCGQGSPRIASRPKMMARSNGAVADNAEPGSRLRWRKDFASSLPGSRRSRWHARKLNRAWSAELPIRWRLRVACSRKLLPVVRELRPGAAGPRNQPASACREAKRAAAVGR